MSSFTLKEIIVEISIESSILTRRKISLSTRQILIEQPPIPTIIDGDSMIMRDLHMVGNLI